MDASPTFIPLDIDETMELHCPDCIKECAHDHVLIPHKVYFEIPASATTVQNVIDAIKKDFKTSVEFNVYIDDARVHPSTSVKIFNGHSKPGQIRIGPGKCSLVSTPTPRPHTEISHRDVTPSQGTLPTRQSASSLPPGDETTLVPKSDESDQEEASDDSDRNIPSRRVSANNATSVFLDTAIEPTIRDSNSELPALHSPASARNTCNEESYETTDADDRMDTSCSFIRTKNDPATPFFRRNPALKYNENKSLLNKRKLTWTAEELSSLGETTFGSPGSSRDSNSD